MKIRKASADDIPRIKPLYRQIIARLYELAPLYRVDCEQEDEFIKKTIECESSEILVAEEDGGLLAFALLEGRETAKLAGVAPRRYAFLMDICVDEKLRGLGIGSALLAAAKNGRERKIMNTSSSTSSKPTPRPAASTNARDIKKSSTS